MPEPEHQGIKAVVVDVLCTDFREAFGVVFDDTLPPTRPSLARLGEWTHALKAGWRDMHRGDRKRLPGGESAPHVPRREPEGSAGAGVGTSPKDRRSVRLLTPGAVSLE